ncbi:hypothetical protein [Streptomyces sp. NPDC048825]|uniref:hypothetical protein n=1 Tax=Streptomyces sp. NPDC048825 TaxID=3365592 RepID=UPI00371A16B9
MYGEFGGNVPYALAARRHMELYGTTSEQLGAIAVAQREWALLNPHAQMKKPMTIEDHQSSRMVPTRSTCSTAASSPTVPSPLLCAGAPVGCLNSPGRGVFPISPAPGA